MVVLLIGVGGFAGAVARYLVDSAVTSAVGARFPVGILLVNVSGAFLLGLLYALSADRGALPEAIRGPVFVGFLGAYTTFSTLALDTWRLGEAGTPWLALLNLVASCALGLLATGVGLLIGRSVGS